MGKLIKRQNLTERQYLRANRVMCSILLVSYLVYIIVEIVDSIGLLSAASEETSAGMQVCKQTTGMAFKNLGRFSRKVKGAFGDLQHLKEAAGS